MSPRVTGFLHTRAYNQCGGRLLSLPQKCCIWASVLTQQPTVRETWTSKERVIVKFFFLVVATFECFSQRFCLEDFSFQLRWNNRGRMCSLIWESSPPNKHQKSQQFSKHLRNWQHKQWTWNKPSLILSLLIAEASRLWTCWSTADTLSWGIGIGRLKNWTENSLWNRAPREERQAAWVLSRLATALHGELPEGGNSQKAGREQRLVLIQDGKWCLWPWGTLGNI